MKWFRNVLVIVVAFALFGGSLYTLWTFAEFNQPEVLLSEEEAIPTDFTVLQQAIPYRIEGLTPPFLQNMQSKGVHEVMIRYLNLPPDQYGLIVRNISEKYTGLIRYDWLKPESTDVYTFRFDHGVFIEWEFRYRFRREEEPASEVADTVEPR